MKVQHEDKQTYLFALLQVHECVRQGICIIVVDVFCKDTRWTRDRWIERNCREQRLGLVNISKCS